MKKWVKNLTLILLSVLLAFSLVGCDDTYEDGEYYEEEYSDDYSDEYSDDDFEDYDSESGNDYSEDESDSDEESVSFSGNYDLLDDSQFPFGSCRKLEGKVILVSIFANDATSSWDFIHSEQDLQTYRSMVAQTRIGCDWIEQQAAAYGVNVEIISDFEADNDLFYQGEIDANFDDNQYHIDAIKGYIGDAIDGVGEQLLEKYGADNICYAFYFNKPADSQMSSCAYEYLGPESDLPYECVLYSAHVYGSEQGPAMYAHEILHCFGAPDLYFANNSIEPIVISQEFSDYCKENHINEIMYSNYDVINNTINNDMVTNDLTDLTAYYLGWVDYNEECEQFGAADREDK